MYAIAIKLFSLFIRIAAFFGHTKAMHLVRGQKHVWKQIESRLQPDERRIWIHCASVGEFEQGRPLIEDIRQQCPQYKILLTFFSSSGYELRKDYSGADYVFYLPFDRYYNARRFVNLVKPEIIYFIKYEFWRNYLKVIKHHKIPLYLVSAIFRPEQVFFKWYGGWYRKLLRSFTHFFVQNEQSKMLLASIAHTNVTVTGDTRFDRVCRIFDTAQQFPEVERFVDGKLCVVVGSSWQHDEEIIVRYINTKKRVLKWIFAPHELHDNQIARLTDSIKSKTVRYSQLSSVESADYQVLIIDNIGMLSSLYRYGTVAYIGGGFGKGIHNTLEAAVYNIPVFFGPAYKKFQEAVDLVNLGGAFSITNYDEFALQLDYLLDNKVELQNAGEKAGAFVSSGRGATAKVMKESLLKKFKNV